MHTCREALIIKCICDTVTKVFINLLHQLWLFWWRCPKTARTRCV